MVSALFVRQDSIYKTMPGVDAWDIDRNAAQYPGPHPVICHPPCRGWGRLKAFANPRPGELELGPLAIQFVRRYGGVLEHPISTGLVSACELPMTGTPDKYGGFCISIDQHWFGHLAAKRTLLYICGISRSQVPVIPLCFDAVTHKVGGLGKLKKSGIYRRNTSLKVISKADNERTPVSLAQWLVDLASRCTDNPAIDTSSAYEAHTGAIAQDVAFAGAMGVYDTVKQEPFFPGFI